MSDKHTKDDFWDIGKLLPKRSSARLSAFRTDTPVSTYEPPAEVDAAARPDSERKLTNISERGVRESEDTTYTPSGAGLVKRVTVKRTIDKYDFYDSFRKSALLYFDYNASRCDFAQFYSYMPQYAHLTPSQKNYYFWWRSCVRAGEYIKTDYSYLYLYVYEVLNLPDKIPPKEGIKLLCRLWREYRSALPRIDNYFAIWIADYCLVHGLPAPMGEISDFLFDCISAAPLKEFYLSDISEVGLGGTDSLLAYLSDYDWRRGKHAGDSLPATVSSDSTYRGHMIRAMYLLLSDIWERSIGGEGAKRSVLVRDAFPGTLCTHSVKCRLEIEYISFAESDELRSAVSAAVRYTENKLRALLGVRARLAVKGLPDEYAVNIDRYFAGFIAEEEKRRKIASRPAYEKLYEAPSETLSLEGAEKIERLSWINAERLVVDEDELTYVNGISHLATKTVVPEVGAPDITDNDTIGTLGGGPSLGDGAVSTLGSETDAKSDAICTPAAESEPSYADNTGISTLSAEEIAYLRGLLGLDTAAELSTPRDSLAERINEVFVDIIGDVLLEADDEGYRIIEDYREEALDLICSLP